MPRSALDRALAALDTHHASSVLDAGVRRFAPLRNLNYSWQSMVRDGRLSPEAGLQLARLSQDAQANLLETGTVPSVRAIRALAAANGTTRTRNPDAPRSPRAAPRSTNSLVITADDATMMVSVCASVETAIYALPRSGSCHDAFAARLNELLDEMTNYTEVSA